MKETISHEGVVVKISDNELEIKILSKSACAACHAKSACTMSDMAEKTLTIPRPRGREFQLQQAVTVKMRVSQGNKAAILAYLVPFIVLVGVLFTMLGIGMNEGLAALVSIAALAPYYLLLYLRREQMNTRFDYSIE